MIKPSDQDVDALANYLLKTGMISMEFRGMAEICARCILEENWKSFPFPIDHQIRIDREPETGENSHDFDS